MSRRQKRRKRPRGRVIKIVSQAEKEENMEKRRERY